MFFNTAPLDTHPCMALLGLHLKSGYGGMYRWTGRSNSHEIDKNYMKSFDKCYHLAIFVRNYIILNEMMQNIRRYKEINE